MNEFYKYDLKWQLHILHQMKASPYIIASGGAISVCQQNNRQQKEWNEWRDNPSSKKHHRECLYPSLPPT